MDLCSLSSLPRPLRVVCQSFLDAMPEITWWSSASDHFVTLSRSSWRYLRSRFRLSMAKANFLLSSMVLMSVKALWYVVSGLEVGARLEAGPHRCIFCAGLEAVAVGSLASLKSRSSASLVAILVSLGIECAEQVELKKPKLSPKREEDWLGANGFKLEG